MNVVGTIARLAAVVPAAAAALVVYWFERALVAYDLLSYRVPQQVRETLSRPSGEYWMWAAPAFLSVLAAVFGGWLALATCLAAWPVAEAYSATLHGAAARRYYDPATLRHRPWGWPPADARDLRLQSLLQLAARFTVGILAALIIASVAGAPLAGLAVAPFAGKFYEHASWDFEVVLHWDMHLRALDVRRGPSLARAAADWLVGPMLGYVPLVYRGGHTVVHHRENVGPDDPHSPLPYSRTSFLEFGVFFTKMTLYNATGIESLLHRRMTWAGRSRILTGIALYAAALIGAWLADWWPLALYLMVTALLRGYVAARAIYTWHGFIDQDRLRHPCFSSLTWIPRLLAQPEAGGEPITTVQEFYAGWADVEIPRPESGWAFFDNFHAIHHLNPRAHYTDYPRIISERLPGYLASDLIMMDIAAVASFPRMCWQSNFEAIGQSVISPLELQEERLIRAQLAPYTPVRSPLARVSETPAGKSLERLLRRLI